MKKRAFTLFELLVSISIIGILIAVASLSYGTAQKKARDARRIEDMNSIQKAAEMYYSQNNYVYPPTTLAFITGGVLQKWPSDPKGSAAVSQYTYKYGVGSSYCACAYLDLPAASANSINPDCASGASLTYYCVKFQQ